MKLKQNKFQENPKVKGIASSAKEGAIKAGSAVKNAVWNAFGWKKEEKNEENYILNMNQNQMFDSDHYN